MKEIDFDPALERLTEAEISKVLFDTWRPFMDDVPQFILMWVFIQNDTSIH